MNKNNMVHTVKIRGLLNNINQQDIKAVALHPKFYNDNNNFMIIHKTDGSSTIRKVQIVRQGQTKLNELDWGAFKWFNQSVKMLDDQSTLDVYSIYDDDGDDDDDGQDEIIKFVRYTKEDLDKIE